MATSDHPDPQTEIDRLRRRIAIHFDHDPRPQLVVDPHGTVREANLAARRLFEDIPATLGELLPGLDEIAAVESGEPVTCELADGRQIGASWSPLPTERGQAILITFQPFARTAGLEIPAALDAIGSVTEHVLHEVRNLMLPLTVQLDLALASVDSGSNVYEALLEMQSSCRSCGVTLDRIETVADPSWSPDGVLHARDLFERTRLILRYALPDRVRVQIDAAETLPMVRAQLRHLQEALLKIVARGPRETLDRVMLRAIPRDDLVWLEVLLECAGDCQVRHSEAFEASVASARSEDIVDDAVEVREHRIAVRLALRTVAEHRAPAAERNGSGGRVLLLHDDVLRREIVRNFLADRGFSVSCDRNEDEYDVLVAEHGCLNEAPDFTPRVILGAESAAATDDVVAVRAPYRLDDVAAAVTMAISAPPRAAEEK